MKKQVKFNGFDCNVKFSIYTNNNATGILLVDDDGDLVTVASVNINEEEGEVLPDEVAIKDYSENEGIVDVLVDAGVIDKDSVRFIPSLFVIVPVFKLSDEAFEEVNYYRKPSFVKEN